MTLILKGIKSEIDVKVCAECECDNGTTVKVPFVITVKKPTNPERDELIKRLEPEIDDDGNTVRPVITDAELAEEFVLGWKNLQDADGNEVLFSIENLHTLIGWREYATAIRNGMMEVIHGRAVAAKAKNWLRLDGSGR